jgi:hypothetical protein
MLCVQIGLPQHHEDRAVAIAAVTVAFIASQSSGSIAALFSLVRRQMAT